jgi:probable HAF family extracellular repeat protein
MRRSFPAFRIVSDRRGLSVRQSGHWLAAALLIFTLMSAFPLAGNAQSTYDMVELGSLGGARAFPYAINERGQVVGSSQTVDGSTHAFLWQDGVMTDLGTLGGHYSIATDINNRGQIVGQSENADGIIMPVLWENGSIIELATLSDPPYGYDIGGHADAINERGQIVGWSERTDEMFHAVLWERGRIIDLGTLPGQAESVARDINNRGQIIGWDDGFYPIGAWIWENGVMTSLGTLGPEWTRHVPNAINNRGQIVGESNTNSGLFRAFLWDDGTMTDLGAVLVNDINNRGQRVGSTVVPVSGPRREHATLWYRDTVIDLHPADSESSAAVAINEHGQIAGWVSPTSGTLQPVLWERRGQ